MNTITLAKTEYSNSTKELIEAFWSGRNPRTLLAYRQHLDDFKSFLKLSTLKEAVSTLINRGQGGANGLLLQYRQSLMKRHASATINSRLAAVRSLVKLARTLGIITFSLDVKNVRSEPYRDTRGPGSDGINHLFSALKARNDPKGLRDLAIVHLLYDLALRREEVVQIDLSDVDIKAGSIWVHSKGRREEKVMMTLSQASKDAISKWMEVRGSEDGALFTNFDRAGKGHRLTGTAVYYLVKALGEQVGLNVQPHKLRHAAITSACQAAQYMGLGLEEVMDYSRHKSVAVLMVYRDRERNVQGKLAEMVASKVAI